MDGIPGLLPADVLLYIFSYFSFRDLVKVQFVCKWWQQVSRDKRLWRDILYKPEWIDSTQMIIDNLKVSPELRALDLRHVERDTVTKELIEEIINRCPQLEQLSVLWDCLYGKIYLEMKKIKILILEDFNVHFNLCGRVCFKYIHDFFPNVEHLDCGSLMLSASDLEAYLREKGDALQSISCRCSAYYTLPYLSVCTKLKSLTLSHVCNEFVSLPVQSVEHLKQISSLTVKDSDRFDIAGSLTMFMYFPNLVVLHFDGCLLPYQQALLFAAENCPLLEKLTLSSLSIVDYHLRHISNFKKLTSLCLRSNLFITDACVADLQTILELRYLDITYCGGLTPQCLLVLCSFDKLQTLKFDLQNRDLPADLSASHVKNPGLHIKFYNCKDTSVLDRLRSQRLRLSLLKDFMECDSMTSKYFGT